MLVYCKSSFKPKKKKRTPVAKAKKFVAFNKGNYTYIASEEQAKWVGRK